MYVSLSNFGHYFRPGQWLFRGLTVEFEPGEVYGLVGPSGSGKSTLLSLIAGWVRAVEGSVSMPQGTNISWVFQNPCGVAQRSGLDHVVLPLLAQGMSRGQAEVEALEILDRFALGKVAEQRFSSLSGGEAQRLMLARAVASKPDLFLIDEPTAQLDLNTRREVNAVIGQLASHDTVVIVATHDEDTRNMCTSIVDLHDYQDSSQDARLSSQGEGAF